MRARDYLNYPDLKVRGFALVYNTHQRALTVIKEVIQIFTLRFTNKTIKLRSTQIQ